MASVLLTELWIHLLADQSQYVRVPWFGSLEDDEVHVGEVRLQTAGRERLTMRPGARRNVSVSYTTDAAVARQVQAWAGELVALRDAARPVGRRVVGVYLSAPVREIDGGDLVEQSFALQRVTVDETVD